MVPGAERVPFSDPEVYAPPEKDELEALLEGVAMAGLIGLLRQLGDLAEFAAEIFHDLHEDVMATASRGHGLMLRLQQLEAEFPAIEKAIISQTDHSNFPHDDGVEWHANLQLNQNMITTGDMPRFILDSYEECRGPPHLFTLDKFDVAGAGASLKRYSDPSFFKMEHASDMIEIDGVREMRPRKIKKKAMRWRKGETLESLLVENSESQSTSSKDRASRKVPPRTTKLKSRHLRDSDHKTISRICREQLEEVIFSQEKILPNYSARHYHAKLRSTESSETSSSFRELEKFITPSQSSAKLDVTKVVPINEYDTVETASTPNIGSLFLQADDGQFLASKYGHAELKDTCKKSCVEQNGISSTSDRLHEGKDFKGEESKCAVQLVQEERYQLAVVSVGQDNDRCMPDDIASDQDNFIDALNMESEGEGDSEINTKRDLSAKVEGDKLNSHSKEVESALPVQFSALGPAIEISSGLNGSCNGRELACADSFFVSDSSPSAVSDTKDTESDSASCRQLSGVNWTNNEETSNDVDLIDVSSSSSVLSDDNAKCEMNDDLSGHEQNQVDFLPSNEYHAAVANISDKQSPETSSGINGLTISSNGYDEKAYNSVEHDQNFVLDGTSMISGQPKDVSQDDGESEGPEADHLLLHSTMPNQEQIQLFKEQFEECTSLDTGTSPGRLALLPDMDPVVLTNNLGLDNVAFPEKMDTNATPTGLDPDGIRWHLNDLDSGVAPIQSSTLNNPVHESDDDEIVKELHCLQDEDLYKHVAEDQETVALEKGHCPIKLNTHKDDPTQGSVVPRHFSNVQGIPGLAESVSPFQDDTEAHGSEMLVPSPCVLNDHIKPSSIGSPLTSSTASLLGTSSSCMEHLESIETGKNVECHQILVDAEVASLLGTSSSCMEHLESIETGKVVECSQIPVDTGIAEGSTTSMFDDAMILCNEERTNGAKYTENAEVLATNSREKNSRHDVSLQSSSCREHLETIEATCENFGSLEESREHICKESMVHTSNLPEPIEIETSGKTFTNSDDIQCLSTLHFPEESIFQEKLPEEASLSAEVPCQYDLDKDGAASLKCTMVREQPSDVDQYLVTELSAPDSVVINPFMDPGYVQSCADPSPSMSYQPCCSEEEQEFLSELLIQHGDTGARKDMYPRADPLWESATPPDEAPLPSEVMTEEDFKSFCHEYLEMDFTAVTTGFDNKPSSDSDDITNGCVVNELQFPCSVSVLPVGLDQEVVCSKPDSQLAGFSSARDIPGETSGPFSAKEVPDGEIPGVDSDLICHESIGDEEITGRDTPSIPVELEPETHVLPGVDSDSCSWLLNDEKISQKYGSPSGNIVPVKDEQETCVNLVPHAFITETLDEMGIHLNNSVPVKLAVEAHSLDELDVLPLSKPAITQESEVCVLDELDSQVVPSSSIDKMVDNLDVHPMRTALEMEESSEDHISGEHDSQIATSFVGERIDELDALFSSDAVLVETETEICVPGELDSPIAPCSLLNGEIHELDPPSLSCSVLVEHESEDHDSGDSNSSTNEKIVRPDATTSRNVIPVDLGWEACSSPELDYHIAPWPLSDDKVGERGLPQTCNVLVESENISYCSPESDFQIALGPSDSGAVAEISTVSSTSVMPNSDENYMVSPVPPESSPYVSNEDPEKPPPLPPLQWRLGRPRLGLLSTNGQMCQPARGTTTVLPASSEELDNSLGPLNGIAESIAPSSSQGTKERYQNSMVENNDQRVEFERLSTLPTVNDVARTEYYKPFSEACEDIKHQGHMSLAATEVGEHLNDGKATDGMDLHPLNPSISFPTYEHEINKQTPQWHILHSDISDSSEHPTHTDPAVSVCEDDKMVDNHNATDGVHLYTTSSSTPGHISENGCFQQPQRDESFSGTSEKEERSSNTSYEEKNLIDESMKSESPTDTAKHTLPDPLLEEGNSLGSQNLQEQDAENHKGDLPEGPSPIAESIVSQDCPHGNRNMETENIHQSNLIDESMKSESYEEKNLIDESMKSESPTDTAKHTLPDPLLEEGNSLGSQNLQEQDAENHKGDLPEGPSPIAESIVSQDYPHGNRNMETENIHQSNLFVSCSGDESKHVSDLDEGSYVQAEQPPVMGWTVGPQMLHPNYGISMEERRFEPEVTDHRLMRKPISMKNIPRNPLVDAVAAHDRSTMRKISELAPPTDKPKANDINLLLEQIRNKTFDLKPVGSTKPTSMRSPSRASTRNLKVSAIIEKANAIRQAVGSDDEDEDSWSDT